MTGVRLTPWAGFSFEPPSAASRACERIARLLANGKWRKWDVIVQSVVESEGLTPEEVGGLLEGMTHTGCVEVKAGEVRRVRMARYLYRLCNPHVHRVSAQPNIRHANWR